MRIKISFKDNYELTLNGVHSIQSGNQFVSFAFQNEQVHKGTLVIDINKIESLRFVGCGD